MKTDKLAYLWLQEMPEGFFDEAIAARLNVPLETIKSARQDALGSESDETTNAKSKRRSKRGTPFPFFNLNRTA